MSTESSNAKQFAARLRAAERNAASILAAATHGRYRPEYIERLAGEWNRLATAANLAGDIVTILEGSSK